MASWVPDPWSTLFRELLRPCETGWSDCTDKRQFGSLLSWNCEFDWLKDADMKPSDAERLTRCPWVLRSLKIRSSGPEWDVQLKNLFEKTCTWKTTVWVTIDETNLMQEGAPLEPANDAATSGWIIRGVEVKSSAEGSTQHLCGGPEMNHHYESCKWVIESYRCHLESSNLREWRDIVVQSLPYLHISGNNAQ